MSKRLVDVSEQIKASLADTTDDVEITSDASVTDESAVETVAAAESVERVGVYDPMATQERVELTRYYIGKRSNEDVLKAGEYVADDLRKYGNDFPEYLIANGYARWVGN
jgi:hypothetical protein